MRHRPGRRLSVARGTPWRHAWRLRPASNVARTGARALRYPDRSLVIDLSHCRQDEKIEYIRAVLPALNAIQRRVGFPHRIVVDEAHYFLHDSDAMQLLDLDSGSYTFVTYCASRLPKALLDSTEVMIVTGESNPAETDALFRLCQPGDRQEWDLVGRLCTGQAVVLPITAESGGRLRLFTVATRLTTHVRHRQKYVDVPVSDHRAFVFDGQAGHVRARTLREFVRELEHGSQALEPFVGRNDFSRWIKDVFGDHALAADLRAIEVGRRTASLAADDFRPRRRDPRAMTCGTSRGSPHRRARRWRQP